MIIEIIRGNKKVKFAREILEKLDSLYDDLTYDNDEKEVECIKSRIKVREELLKQMGDLS
jgi:hypothetical protein